MVGKSKKKLCKYADLTEITQKNYQVDTYIIKGRSDEIFEKNSL